jgi:DNA helicase-2/ATP-dependent DNA helicase PcrA
MMKRYLKGLNDEQRRAVKYGVTAESPINKRPLLVLAGAGSGKTKVIAHRVAHVVIRGIDPQRVLLLTFTKRAAQEMIRRVERIATAALKTEQLNLPWAGTFHSIGTRLLREYARRIGLGPSFTIHDRSDSEDMINWLRHDLGFSETESRFPLKGEVVPVSGTEWRLG